jgi:hypothetical protein
VQKMLCDLVVGIFQMACSLGRIEVDKFFGNNFEMWKLKMKDLLIDQDLWDVVDESVTRLSNPI